MSNLHPGQPVVCIDAAPICGLDMDGLTEGAVYTIRWIGIHDGDVSVRLTEIVRWTCPARGEADLPYLASRFRPVHTTSIAVFTAMLAPTPRVRESA